MKVNLTTPWLGRNIYDDKSRKLVLTFLRNGYNLTPEALSFLQSQLEPFAFIHYVISKQPKGAVVTIDYLRRLVPAECSMRRAENVDVGGTPSISLTGAVSDQGEVSKRKHDMGDKRQLERIGGGSLDVLSTTPPKFRQLQERLSRTTSILVPHMNKNSTTILDLDLLFESVLRGRVKDVEDESPSVDAPPLSVLLQGRPICSKCGRSDDVIKRDIYLTKHGEIRDYYSCTSCRMRVPTNPTGRRHSPRIIAVTLSRFFSGESSRNIERGMLEE